MLLEVAAMRGSGGFELRKSLGRQNDGDSAAVDRIDFPPNEPLNLKGAHDS